MNSKSQGYKSRKSNVYLSDDEWKRWRIWLVKHNRSSSLVLSDYIRKLVGAGRKRRAVVKSKRLPPTAKEQL